MCLGAAPIKFLNSIWPRERKFIQFCQVGKAVTFDSPWSLSTSTFYALIGQNLTGEFMRKIYVASGNLFTDSCGWQSFVWSCDVFKWNTAACKILLLFMSSLFIGLLVEKCTSCQSRWQSDLGWHRVHFGWCVRGWKAGLTWWLSGAGASRLVRPVIILFDTCCCFALLSFSGFMKSSVVYAAMHVCRIWDNEVWQAYRILKSLQTFCDRK